MKDFFQKLNEIRKTPRGGALLFFGFYFIFFLVIALMIRSSKSSTYNSNSETNLPYKINNIESNNYSYDYSIIEDKEEYKVTGSKEEEIEHFTYKNKNYYKNDKYYIQEDKLEEVSETDKLYPYMDFTNFDNVRKLLENATYESKTTYESGKTNYNYLISTNTINKLLDNQDTDFFEEPNKMTIVTDSNNNAYEIHLYLDSYCTLNEYCNESLKISLKYDNFGSIQNIDNPLDETE